MEWLAQMSKALDYIEQHLTDRIEMEEVAKAAASSPFHFQRSFSFLTGVTVVEYIRRRRLTLAAQELALDSEAKIVDIAFRYGYETPEAFTKAFKRSHGVAPSVVRNQDVTLRAFPRISFSISLKGDIPVDYKLIEKPGFKIVGKGVRVSTHDGENHNKIPDFWSECNSDGTCDRLLELSDDKQTLGICLDMDFRNEEFTYMAAAKYSGSDEIPGMVTREIPASLWAVFTSIGPMPRAIQDVTTRIFQEWFPSTGYEHADGPELEVYPMGDMSAADYRCEVWIPVIKK